MAFDLMSGNGLGSQADELRQQLTDLFTQAVTKQRLAQEAQRIAIEQQRANTERDYKDMTAKSLEDERQARIAAANEGNALKLGGAMRVGQDVGDAADATLTKGGLGDLVQRTGQVPTRNISGVAETGTAAPRIVGLASTTNAGLAPKKTYLGTDAQQKAASDERDLQTLMNDPNLPPQVRNFLRIRSAVPGGAVPAELFKTDNPMEPVYRQNPRTGGIERVGEAPKGAHFMTEPPPKDTTTADANRAQQSYQYHATQLANLRKPVEDQAAKVSDLNDLLAQGTPQADALVAPKLLSTLVGGQGSGLRMNEAEIARIVGGRSKWENLRAAAQQWSTNPATANSITPEQRSQIRALVEAASKKNAAQLKTLDDAGDALASSADPMQHRAILNSAHKALTTISTGGGGGSAPAKGGDPLGIR